MKSAYELAMERLQKEAPSRPLTDEAKAAIAEIEQVTLAKIAERELFLKEQIAKARADGQAGEAAAIEAQLASEIRRIREDGEAKKEKIRAGGA